MNNTHQTYRIKITGLPPNIDIYYLSDTFHIPPDVCCKLPRRQNYDVWHAFIVDIKDENYARQLVSRIIEKATSLPNGRIINCKYERIIQDNHLSSINVEDYTQKIPKESDNDRQTATLPILKIKDEFVRRLKQYKILVITAETGSGKTTQLSQYAAEMFNGLIVCTQPRVMAAISIAKCVAHEYDGGNIGMSVGYQVGGRQNGILGKKIMFMTDSAVIRKTQEDNLNDVTVLIIDEAHERSLNTDIVLGIAKLICQRRPDDFHVVIASATIKHEIFLKFFNCDEKTQFLTVPGKPHLVTSENIPASLELKEDELIRNHLIPLVLKTINTYKEGHTLVFLSGQREIELAIREFKKSIPHNCIALPLYGSLSPEEQDKVLQYNSKERMIVFCTNVAETSLTVPNVRLIIDSGLAKEAHFDVLRRLNVIELVRISKSSAEQRRGRAGRTSTGHCIRLFSDEELVRDNIEPEILRLSLDQIVLQLIRLDQDPLKFYYVTTPKRGKLFTKLCFDPRLSSFILDADEKYNRLYLATTIAAILSAPGSIFYFGSQDRNEVKARIASGAIEYDSDLMYLNEVYKSWKEARNCVGCKQKTINDGSCRSCGVEFSLKKGLNNKLLEIIKKTYDSTIEIIGRGRTRNIQHTKSDFDVIGECLSQAFPEQIGHVLVPHLPDHGVRLIYSNTRARISDTSAFLQRIRSQPFHTFISMTITILPFNDCIVERLHPLSGPPSLKEGEEIVPVYSTENVGSEFNNRIKCVFDDYFKLEDYLKWSVYEYINLQNRLVIHGRTRDKAEIHRLMSRICSEIHQQLLSDGRKKTLANGRITATFKSGLNVVTLDDVHEKYHLILYNIPPKSEKDFQQWIISLNLSFEDISEYHFQEETSLVFTSEEALRRASVYLKSYLQPQPIYKRQLCLVTPKNVTRYKVEQTLQKCKNIQHLYSNKGSYKLFIKNFPVDQTIDSLRQLFRVCASDLIDNNTKFELLQNERTAIISFSHISKRDEAVGILKVNYVHVDSDPKDDTEGFEKFLLTYETFQEAIDAFRTQLSDSSWRLNGYSNIIVTHRELFNNFEELLEKICEKVELAYRIENTSHVIFENGGPKETAQAVDQLLHVMSPLKLESSSERQFYLLQEVYDKPVFGWWTKQLDLQYKLLNRSHNFIEIVVYGRHEKQGELIRFLGEYSVEFDKRFHLIPVDLATSNILRKNRAGNEKLVELQKKWSENNCSITYLYTTKQIRVYGSNVAQVALCVHEVNNLLEELGSSLTKFTCDFCHTENSSTESFLICGHHYCKCIIGNIDSIFPIKCRKCNDHIHIKDLEKIIYNINEFEQLCKKSLQYYLESDQNEKRTFCLYEGCSGLIEKNAGYYSCSTCNHMVCVNCKVTDQEEHEGKSCSDYIRSITMQGSFVEQVLSAGEKFIREDWSIDLPPIQRIYPNPYLKRGCPGFERFLNAILISNIKSISIANGIFAYHATSETALDSICFNSFNPKLRYVQLHGPGEYFGLSAAISRAYSKDENPNKMIVVWLLKCERLKKIPGSSYLMNNPVDWSHTFAIAVSIVTYGKETNIPAPIFSQIIPDNFTTDIVSLWKAPYRWHWTDDHHCLIPYDDRINSFLEHNYDKYRLHTAGVVCITPPLIRFSDDQPRTYEINFRNSEQISKINKRRRRIERKRAEIRSTKSSSWSYLDEKYIWCEYDSAVQDRIERYYKRYCAGADWSSVKMRIPGRSEIYEINFVLGAQINLATNVSKPIKPQLLLETMTIAGINRIESNNDSALAVAERNGHTQLVRILCEKTAETEDQSHLPDTSPTEWTIAQEHNERRAFERRRELKYEIESDDEFIMFIDRIKRWYIEKLLANSEQKRKIREYIITAYTYKPDFYRILNTQLSREHFNYDSNDEKSQCEGHGELEVVVFKTYRGMYMTDHDFNQYKVGICILYKSFLSTTKEEAVALRFICQPNFKLRVICTFIIRNQQTALDIEKISAYSGEKEVLILPYSVWEVRNIRQMHRIEIELEECETQRISITE
ncbi:unnamed protein product [Didymodactylos carnosus]|uniref:RNA helicase n=1 Tax=Didymodactylos carnosus TaxID=1234261 RepID=A0A8S2E152_9BILA|nr:unnamed protein product [Didymodactylos carnosus]CAF3819862.1 unnamed protein product [Didymodactylos carnosus]